MKFSNRLNQIIYNESTSLNFQMDQIIQMISNFKDDSLIDQFLDTWKNHLQLIRIKINKKDLSEEDLKEIKQISSEIINSLILNWTIPHQKLEQLLNILIYKNEIIKKINNYSNINESDLIIDEIDEIVKSLYEFNDNIIVNDFIFYWKKDKKTIYNKIQNNQLELNDIREIKKIINNIITSIKFNFIIPHKELEKLLNIITLKNKYVF